MFTDERTHDLTKGVSSEWRTCLEQKLSTYTHTPTHGYIYMNIYVCVYKFGGKNSEKHNE